MKSKFEEMLDARYKMQDAGFGMQDAGCGMQDAGCKMQDANTKNRILKTPGPFTPSRLFRPGTLLCLSL